MRKRASTVKQFRIHVVGLPHTCLTEDFSACAFTERTRKFASFMHDINGHEVFLYGGPESEASVTEFIPCISEDERAAAVGSKHFVHASFDWTKGHWPAFNAKVAEEIRKRMDTDLPQILCVIGGRAHEPIADALPELLLCEMSIGYGGVIPRSFKVFESDQWRHTVYGSLNSNPNAIDGRFYDDVIPGSFSPDDFPFSAEKDDYILFLGRIIERKGIGIAVEVANRLGKKLIIAGQGDPPKGDNIEYRGVVGPEERGELLSKAQALIAPTLYIGPFENTAVEAQFCGTPAIVTPWGAFCSTVEDEKTGFHCHLLRDFMSAVERAPTLDPYYMRERAIRLYSTEAVARQYQRYFSRLSTLFAGGWYEDAEFCPDKVRSTL